MIKRKISSVILVILYFQVASANVAVLSASSTQNNLHQVLHNNPQYISYSQLSEDNLRAKAQSHNIVGEYHLAKTYWLKGDLETARASFTKIIDQAYDVDWLPEQHKLIVFAYLGIAELCTTEFEKKFWVKKALAFSVTGIHDLGSLSPEVKKLIIQESNKADSVGLNFLPDSMSGFSKILINGVDTKDIDLNKLGLRKENYRVTFVSNIYLPTTEIIRGENLEKLNPTKEPAISGSCEFPIINKNLVSEKALIAVYENDCQRKWNGSWVTEINKEYIGLDNMIKASIETPKPVYQRFWFWGALTVGTVLALSLQDGLASE